MTRRWLVLGNAVWIALALCLTPSGCRSRTHSPDVPLARDLRPYDFQGRSQVVLGRICHAAEALGTARRAKALALCARASFDWYLIATLREDRSLLAALDRFLDRLGVLPAAPSSSSGRRALTGVAVLLAKAEAAATGRSIRRAIHAGRSLVLLQRDESTAWGYDYLKGLYEAARPRAPWSIEARVILLGAALDALKTLQKTPLERRPSLLLEGLGFPCPAEAERSRMGDGAPARPPSCPLACPGLRAMVARLAPGRRKTLIAAQCPLADLGLSSRAHGVYLSKDNLALFRVVAFVTEIRSNLSAIVHSEPLAAALAGDVAKLARSLGRLRVPLFYPELSPGEPVYFPLALCPSAEDPSSAPVYVAVDETRLFAGPRPVLGIVAGRAVPLDFHAGYPFPGQPVLATDSRSLEVRLSSLRETFRREIGSALRPAARDRVAIYADAHLSGGRLNDLLDLLVEARVHRVDLMFRNRAGEVRAVTVSLAHRRRSEGPPLAPVRSPAAASLDRGGLGRASQGPAGSGALLAVLMDARTLRLSATSGPLAVSPALLPASAVASLRKTLEKTRIAYRGARGVEVRLGVDVPYHELARLLHNLRTDTSGRPLYSTIWL